MPSFEFAHAAICALIDDFAAHRSKYMDPGYSEAQARLDFIDKFWTSLGWDVGHITQKNPYEQEVRVERTVTVGGAQKRADYAFFAAPNFTQPIFFVEAKKPFVELGALDNCFQLVRYAWNAGCALSVLHDFEELLVLDCRWRPDKETAKSRIWKRFHYTDFKDEAKLRELYHLFSREAASEGAIAKRASELKKPKGKSVQRELFKLQSQTLDESFLSELESWREDLAKGFKRDNEDLDSETLTEITQRTLDRLVFLRFLEDKGIEQQTTIGKLGGRSGSPWTDFQAAGRRLDAIYNGAIFRRHPLLDSSVFALSDDVFGGICEKLDAANSPYDFNVIPIHILGSIYERFLGSVIIATDKRAKVEQKPEVRKAGGVYYTPEYIVRYIVLQTVGRQVAGKTPDQIEKMSFADIACGSGSFLLGVFDCLLRYHTKWFNEHPDKAALPKPVQITKKGMPHRQRREVAGDCFKDPDSGSLRLTLEKKRQILLNNVFGTDLDPQAVEVAQLSLYLKLLEDETAGSTHQYSLDFDREALLPSLESNIVCGNALIGTDISSVLNISPEEEEKLRPMDFETTFPQVFERGGFDAVVGNPPYGALLDDNVMEYLRKGYRSLANSADTFLMCTEKAIKLQRAGGYFGYIIPSGWTSAPSAKPLREFFRDSMRPTSFVSLPYDVFKGAYIDTMIVCGQRLKESARWKNETDQSIKLVVFPVRWKVESENDFSQFEKTGDLRQWCQTDTCEFLALASREEASLIQKLNKESVQFGVYVDVMRGIETYTPSPREGMSHPVVAWNGHLLRYDIHLGAEAFENYPPELQVQKPKRFFAGGRILLRQLISRKFRLQAVFADDFFLTNQSVQSILVKAEFKDKVLPKSLLGILNSKLMSWYFCQINTVARRDDFPKTIIKQTRELPFPKLNNLVGAQVRLDGLVTQLLEAKHQEAAAGNEVKRDFWVRKSVGLDRQIDSLVYELYGLTPEQITLVEGRGEVIFDQAAEEVINDE